MCHYPSSQVSTEVGCIDIGACMVVEGGEEMPGTMDGINVHLICMCTALICSWLHTYNIYSL